MNSKACAHEYILGLHFGQSASITLVKDGEPILVVERERHTRCKQCCFLHGRDVLNALDHAQLSVEEIDKVAVTTSQNVPFVLFNPEEFDLSFSDVAAENVPDCDLGKLPAFKSDLRDLANAKVVSIPDVIECPVTVKIGTHFLSGQYFAPRKAAAAASYYLSGFPDSLVLVQDQGSQTVSVFNGAEGRLEFLCELSSNHVSFYAEVAELLGLGSMGGAGKLMGLAPYGEPLYEVPKDIRAATWVERIAQDLGVTSLSADDPSASTFHKNVAASAQAYFNVELVRLAKEAKYFAEERGIKTHSLCLGGGGSLNCPANSYLHENHLFEAIFIPPACDHSGNSIGAALLLAERKAGGLRSPYLGYVPYRNDIEAALQEYRDQIVLIEAVDTIQHVARSLVENKIVGWFEGRSEIGPRALCHRSILANPLKRENWQRVNEIKKRELWRPFAPVVHEDGAHHIFQGGPLPSPYMLWTHQVKTTDLPAVTHVDNSARIQSVTKTDGQISRLLSCFKEMTGYPALLNTSFNGPDEPIVDSAHDALGMFLNSSIDLLYMDGFLVRKRD